MINITLLCANRPRLLKQALDSIGDLSNATVTIRDAGMNDEVRHLASAWCGANESAYVFHADTPLGTGPARNDAVRKSENIFGRGSHLYLSDDDVYFLQSDWLRVLTTAYDEAWELGYRVLGAYNHPFNRPIHASSLAPRLPSGYRVNEVYALASQSMLMSWEVWDQFGPFCDTPAGKVCQSEDVDFCNKIRESGFKVGVIYPALLVNTGITNSFGDKIPGWIMVKNECPEGIICE